MNFFYLLEEERKRLGLSQAEAGRICGVSREMWGKYERDQAAPGADVLEAFAAAGADVNYILSGRLSEEPSQTDTHRVRQDVLPYGLSADEAALLETYREIDPEARTTLQNLLKVIATAGHAEAVPKARTRQPRSAVVLDTEYKGKRTGPQIFSTEYTGKRTGPRVVGQETASTKKRRKDEAP